MPNYLSPGVYVEEVSGGVKPIAGVGTSTGAFVGIAEKGVPHKAILVTNWGQFVKEFGSFTANGYLAYAVYGFFAEGGTSCYVVRAANTDAAELKASSVTIKSDDNTDTITVTANSLGDEGDRSKGTWGDKISVIIEDPKDKNATHFKLTVTYENQPVEIYDNTDITKIEAALSSSAVLTATVLDAAKRPKNGEYPLTGGKDGISGAVFTGTEDDKKGLHGFDEVDNINIVAIPDKAGDRSVILAALNYCKNRKDCFFIADPPMAETPSGVQDFKSGTGSTYSGNAFNSSFGALYYPWVYTKYQTNEPKKLVPPSGVVSGTLAHTDSTRGVHKAPAGIAEGYLDSVVGIERIITKGEHDMLNPENINVIRVLPQGICIWGARTLSADSEWRYINIRRLLLYIEESVDKGSQWVVFEPNNPALWGKVKRNIVAFLTRVWRDGALFGNTPEEAFFVKVDEENNPPDVRDAGQLIIEVGVAPVKPAEFVIIRISQKTQEK
jgi:uncharacterized protein